jgi:hypothetical protein
VTSFLRHFTFTTLQQDKTSAFALSPNYCVCFIKDAVRQRGRLHYSIHKCYASGATARHASEPVAAAPMTILLQEP